MVIIYRYSELTSRVIKILIKQNKEKITSVIFLYLLEQFNHNLSVSQGTSLQLTKGFLKYYKQRINVNNNFSYWETILTRAPQVTILEYVKATN